MSRPTGVSYIEASKALAKNGVYGFGIGSGAGNSVGSQTLISLMINNGGGLFDKDQNPDAVTDANIEAMDFVKELIALGAVAPGAASYTADNVFEQWRTKRSAWAGTPPACSTSSEDDDIVVASPVTGYSGDTGTLGYVNNLMMYTNTPSQEGSEAFLTAYLDDMKVYWDKKLIESLPVLKSIVELRRVPVGHRVGQDRRRVAARGQAAVLAVTHALRRSGRRSTAVRDFSSSPKRSWAARPIRRPRWRRSQTSLESATS